MITQYSHIQMTLSEEEKEYAWFQYAAELCKAGCRDQSLSGYSVNGTGIDGKPVKAELTNEELFQLFAEITMKYGKRILREHESSHEIQQEAEQEVPYESNQSNQSKSNSLDRRDFQIVITKNEQKTRKADVRITWGNNLQIEGIRIYGRTDGSIRLTVPYYFASDGRRINLMAVGSKLEQAILSEYRKLGQQEEIQSAYYGEETGIRVRTRPAQERKVIGYADIAIGRELQIMQVRIRQNEGKLSCMYPSESIGTGENKHWHNLVTELSDYRMHETILQCYMKEQLTEEKYSKSNAEIRNAHSHAESNPEVRNVQSQTRSRGMPEFGR